MRFVDLIEGTSNERYLGAHGARTKDARPTYFFLKVKHSTGNTLKTITDQS